jgi:hypothetical protein
MWPDIEEGFPVRGVINIIIGLAIIGACFYFGFLMAK